MEDGINKSFEIDLTVIAFICRGEMKEISRLLEEMAKQTILLAYEAHDTMPGSPKIDE